VAAILFSTTRHYHHGSPNAWDADQTSKWRLFSAKRRHAKSQSTCLSNCSSRGSATSLLKSPAAKMKLHTRVNLNFNINFNLNLNPTILPSDTF
jgi:hypothetical protein